MTDIWQQIWDEIADQFHKHMGNEPYGPDFHTHTEGIFNDRTGTYLLKDRYPVWIFRTSWGNNSEFCCERPRKNPKNRITLTQADAARALGCSNAAICGLTKRFAKQGRIHVDEQGRIILNKTLKRNVKVEPAEAKVEYAESERQWRAYFPQYAKEEAEWDETLKKGQARKRWFRTAKLNFHKRRINSGNVSPAPVTDGLFDSGNDPGSYSGNENEPAPVMPSEAPATASLDSHARPTLNNKQQEETSLVSEWLKESLALEVSHSLTEIEQAVVEAYGTQLQANDPIPGQLLAEAQKLGLPVGALCRWLQDFAKKKRASNYKITSPNLFVTSAQKDLALWCRNHPEVVYKYQFQRDVQARERQGAIDVLQDPAATDEERQWARQILGIKTSEAKS